ncbi:MAG: carbohydrate ABC transporter permease [Turicibacter sp.]
MKKNKKINTIIPVFLFPLILVLIVFQIYPIILNVIYSLLDWNGITTTAYFVGLDNYKEILTDSFFWNAIKNSLKFAIVATFLQVTISFCIAYFVEFGGFKNKKLLNIIFILPIVATTAIIGMIMKIIFSYDGTINQLLSAIGIDALNWLGDSGLAFWTIVLVSIWKETGTLFIYWIASFKLVTPSVIEAARMDGVSGMGMLRYIIYPMIQPVVVLVSTITFINALKSFDLIQILTAGGPFFSTDMMSTFIYRTAFSNSFGTPRLGYASSISIFCVLLIGGIVFISRKLSLVVKKRVG